MNGEAYIFLACRHALQRATEANLFSRRIVTACTAAAYDRIELFGCLLYRILV